MTVKKIHQVWLSDNNQEPSEAIKGQMKKLKELYSDYEYTLWNEKNIQDFLSSNFPIHVLEAFNRIRPYAFKCDLARYCILYVFGGYYFDAPLCPEFKYEPKAPTLFRGIPFSDKGRVFDVIENNTLFFPYPEDEFLKESLYRSASNIRNSLYLDHPLAVTSPVLLSSISKKDHIDFGYCKQLSDCKASYYEDTLICKHKENKYVADLSKMGCAGTNNYADMWHNKELY